MMRLCLVAILLALAVPAAAGVVAELDAIDARMTSCLDKNPSNTDMKQCSYAAYEAADKVLNRVYKIYSDRLKRQAAKDDDADAKESPKRLTASERAWIAYRDAECALKGTEMLGGSGEGLIVAQCLYGMTSDRAKSLDKQGREPR